MLLMVVEGGVTMSSKAQLDIPIVGFVVVAIGLIIFAPVMLKVFRGIQVPMSSALGNVSSEAQSSYDSVMSPLVNWWDKVVMFAFVVSIILLLVSAFLIDTHPFFVILYILTCLFTVLIAPSIMSAADSIYENANFVTADAGGFVITNNLPFMDFLRTNFGVVLLVIIFITGVIMYGKVAWFSNQGGR